MSPTPREILIPVLSVLGLLLLLGTFTFFRHRHRLRIQKAQQEAQEKAFANAQDHRFMQHAKRLKSLDHDPELGGIGGIEGRGIDGDIQYAGISIPVINEKGELVIRTDLQDPVNRDEDRSISPMNMEFMIRDAEIARKAFAAAAAVGVGGDDYGLEPGLDLQPGMEEQEQEAGRRRRGGQDIREPWTRNDDDKHTDLRRDTDSGTHSMSADDTDSSSRPVSAHSQTRQIFPVPTVTTPESLRVLEEARYYTEEEGERMGLGRKGEREGEGK
ncbi:hypothetical protein BZA77DRAFT_291847 [Pyronema omphalodes]|nr:hypothetical protein BZA77DRAFT_291847 [Pyronema omphalodes]